MYKHLSHKVLRLSLVLGVLLSIYFIIKHTFLFLLPFLVATLLAFLIHPFVTLLETKLRFPRSLATGVTIMIAFIVIFGSIVLLIAELIQGTTYLAEKIPEHLKTFTIFLEIFVNQTILPYYHKLTSFIHTLNPSQQITINENIQHMIAQMSVTGTDILKSILLKIPAILSMLPNSITVFMFIVLATFLITNDFNTLKQSVQKLVPSKMNTTGKYLLIQLKKALSGFLKAQLILIAITAGSIYIGLVIIGIDHALTIALLAAGVDLLPYIGTGIIFIPWIIYLFIIGNYKLTISLAIVYMFITIVRQLLEPKILSVHVGLHPLAALFALFIGLQLWGVIGLIIAPILLVILNVFYQTGVVKQLWLFINGQ